MTSLVILYENIPDVDILRNSFNTNVEVVNNKELFNKLKFDELSLNTYQRVGLVWEKKAGDLVPHLLKFNEVIIPETDNDDDDPNINTPIVIKNYDNDNYFSNNLKQFINNLKNQNPNIQLDLITCNFNKPKMIQYINQYTEQTSIVVNYSIDPTGNPNNGGDWIMENTNVNIKNLYFNDNINNYRHILATTGTINISGENSSILTITQVYLDTHMDSGVDFTGNQIVFAENVTWFDTWAIIATNDNTDPITIDGGGYTITVQPDGESDGFYGLVQWNSENHHVTVKNINITGGFLATSAGYIIGTMEVTYGGNLTVDNCHILSGAVINRDYTGGICGAYAGKLATTIIKNCSCRVGVGDEEQASGIGGIVGSSSNHGGTMTIYNCYCTGGIYYQSGGICGLNFSEYAGVGTIYNCYSTGEIYYTRSGGICGRYCGYDGGIVYIVNCYSTGDITSRYSGGICAQNCGYINSVVYIINCYSVGNILQRYAGGICGSHSVFDGAELYIFNCYSRGEIYGRDSGGICGYGAGNGESGSGSRLSIYNCYSTGEISGQSAGGITGRFIQIYGYCTIVKCYSTGTISGNYSGGIVGSQLYGNSSGAMIYACYSLGDITGYGAGGICGFESCSYTDYTKIGLYGCYSAGTITGELAGGLCGIDSNVQLVENCYSTRSLQTAINENTFIDGSDDITLMNTLISTYGYQALSGEETYPRLKNFMKVPWTGYTANDSQPTHSSSYINVDIVSNPDVLTINSLIEDIIEDFEESYIVIAVPIRHSLSESPYNTVWAFEIFANAIGEVSDNRLLSELTDGQKNNIINRLNTFYRDEVSESLTFSLYNGSVLASTYDISCFGENTKILTINGYKIIKDLKEGEYLITSKGHITQIKKIGTFMHKGEICYIAENRFKKNLPFEPLIITPNHKIKVHGKWANPDKYCDVIKLHKPIKLYHIQTTNYKTDNIIANGLTAETWRVYTPPQCILPLHKSICLPSHTIIPQ